MLQIQLADPFPQINPEVELIQDGELPPAANEQVVAIGVKSLDLHPRQIVSGFGLNAFPHFLGGVVGIGKSEDFVGTSMTFADQPRDASREDGRLSGARTGHNQHRAADVFNGLPLAVVWLEGWCGRDGFAKGHWGGGYQRVLWCAPRKSLPQRAQGTA